MFIDTNLYVPVMCENEIFTLLIEIEYQKKNIRNLSAVMRDLCFRKDKLVRSFSHELSCLLNNIDKIKLQNNISNITLDIKNKLDVIVSMKKELRRLNGIENNYKMIFFDHLFFVHRILELREKAKEVVVKKIVNNEEESFSEYSYGDIYNDNYESFDEFLKRK